MADGIKIVIDRVGDFLSNVESLTAMDVLVGVPEAEADREDGDSEGINNAALAYIHDNGAPEANIPARPFMVDGIEEGKADIDREFNKAGKAALDGNMSEASKHFHIAGQKAAISIQKKIHAGPFEPLAPLTIARRKSRKIAPRQGTKPLIDTAQLLRSITYVVTDGKKE